MSDLQIFIAALLVSVALLNVLATVACGLDLGYRAPELQGPQTRLRTQTLWEFLEESRLEV